MEHADRARRPGGRARSLARALRHASRARLRLRGAVRRRRLPRAGPLARAASADPLGRDRRGRAARDPGRALLPHLRLRALAARSPALALLVAALFAVATEILTKREPRPGLPSAAAIFATGSIAALALALTLRAGERLAHRRARPDGAGHRLGRTSSARCRGCAALCGILVGSWCCASATSRASSPTSAPRRSSTGSSMATAFRRSRSGSRAALLRKRADDTPTRMVECRRDPAHRADRRSSRSATTSIGGDIYYPSAALTEARAAGLRRARDGDRTGAPARAHATRSCTTSPRS